MFYIPTLAHYQLGLTRLATRLAYFNSYSALNACEINENFDQFFWGEGGGFIVTNDVVCLFTRLSLLMLSMLGTAITSNLVAIVTVFLIIIKTHRP